MHINPFKKLLKMCLASFLCRSRIKTILPRILVKRQTPIILYYHRICERENGLSSREITVSVETFEKQIEFLKSNFSIRPLNVIVDRIRNNVERISNDISITFDDGYIDNYRHAYPILKKYGVPATIFMTTGYVGSSRLFWWDELSVIVNSLKNDEVDWEALPSNRFSNRLKGLLKKAVTCGTSLTPLTNYLKSIGTEKREEILQYLKKNLANKVSFASIPRLFLSWHEIKEMSNNGIDFGSHSHSHAVLTEISDEDLSREVYFSKNLIKENIGREVQGFSYPDGVFDERVKRRVIEAGYDYAVQTFRNSCRGPVDAYSIPRRMVKEGHSKGCFGNFSQALFAFELSGWADSVFLRNKRRKNPYEH